MEKKERKSLLTAIVQARYPFLSSWSPDGDKIAYCLGGVSGVDVMVCSVPDGVSKLLVSDIPFPRSVGPWFEQPHLSWREDGGNIVFNKRNAFYEVSAKGGETKLLASVQHVGQAPRPMLSPDQKNLAFLKDDAVWIKPIPEGEPYQLTKKIPSLSWGAEIVAGGWSPDSKKIAFSSYGERSSIGVVSLESGEVWWIDPTSQVDDVPVWSHDSSKLAFVRGSLDGKWTELRVASVHGDDVRSIWRDRDERWTGHVAYGASWSHDNKRIAFVSNRDGWSHLYVAPLNGGQPRQLTKGNYEVLFEDAVLVTRVGRNPSWSPDDSEIAFLSNRDSLQERHVWVVPSKGGEARKLADMTGFSQGFQWSPDGKYISFIWSGPSQTPTLWIADASGEEEPIPIYNNLPEGVTKEDFANMKPVKYKSTDGTTIQALLLTPRDLNKDKKYPAVVFVYGGGLQIALLGQYAYCGGYLFDSYLIQKGYIVLRVDPRGTHWYGKDFHTAVHHTAGGIDGQVQDLESATKYLESLGYVDPEGIGLIGGSNGGFLTAQTLVQAPEAFAAGIPLAGVYDAKDLYEYYSKGVNLFLAWILARWGHPRENPDLCRKWSPANHADKLKAAIFVVHGDLDTNAPFSHAKNLVTALIKEGKDFDFMMYPGQAHNYLNTEYFMDYLKRFERFFDKHLKRR